MSSNTHHSTEPKWRRLPEERPRQILEAALAELSERGLAGAKLDDIAKRARVAKGTIYLYFPKKEDLFREVIRGTIVAAVDRAEKIPTDIPPTEQMRRYAENFWEMVLTPEYPALLQMVTGEMQQFPDLVSFFNTEVIERRSRIMGRIIKRGVATGDFRDINPETAARMLAALFISNSMWCSKRDCFKLIARKTNEEVFEDIYDFFSHAIGAR